MFHLIRTGNIVFHIISTGTIKIVSSVSHYQYLHCSAKCFTLSVMALYSVKCLHYQYWNYSAKCFTFFYIITHEVQKSVGTRTSDTFKSIIKTQIISQPKQKVVGAQKNRFNKMALLSNQNK